MQPRILPIVFEGRVLLTRIGCKGGFCAIALIYCCLRQIVEKRTSALPFASSSRFQWDFNRSQSQVEGSAEHAAESLVPWRIPSEIQSGADFSAKTSGFGLRSLPLPHSLARLTLDPLLASHGIEIYL